MDSSSSATIVGRWILVLLGVIAWIGLSPFFGLANRLSRLHRGGEQRPREEEAERRPKPLPHQG